MSLKRQGISRLRYNVGWIIQVHRGAHWCLWKEPRRKESTAVRAKGDTRLQLTTSSPGLDCVHPWPGRPDLRGSLPPSMQCPGRWKSQASAGGGRALTAIPDSKEAKPDSLGLRGRACWPPRLSSVLRCRTGAFTVSGSQENQVLSISHIKQKKEGKQNNKNKTKNVTDSPCRPRLKWNGRNVSNQERNPRQRQLSIGG